jgi:23S rRNA (guanine745-N1)-methyltransferase
VEEIERTTSGLRRVLPSLRCPHCDGGLTTDGNVVRCGEGHTFDVARHGYVSLLPGDAQRGTADTAAMVAARERFLSTGRLEPLAEAIVGRMNGHALPATGAVVDVGAGTGQLLAHLLDRLPHHVGIAIELSKYALRRAARAHPRAAAVAADAWRPLPLRDHAAAAVISVFAPRNAPEFHRILRPDGLLVVAIPTGQHLTELVRALDLVTVDEHKDERLGRQLEGLFEPVARSAVRGSWYLGRDDVVAAVAMGPSAYRFDPKGLDRRVRSLPATVRVTFDVSVIVCRPLAEPAEAS